MKKSLLFTLLFSGSALAWQTPLFPKFIEIEPHLFQSKAELNKGIQPFQFKHQNQCFQPESVVKLNQTIQLIPCGETTDQLRLFRQGNYIAEIDLRSGKPEFRLSIEQSQTNDNVQTKTCPTWNGELLEIDVSAVFKEGDRIRDFYSGKTQTVQQGKVHFQPDAQSNGLLLLEKLYHSTTKNSEIFHWGNATVYFVITDRFHNGDPNNDNSYGRQKDGMEEIATFHGGDLKGLSEKLDYLQSLGVNALWISSPLEQMHGWVGGGTKGDFPHYAYHGYYHQDWTKIDANMGTEQDLKNLIEQAHKRGIRVIFDVVMNHTGYASLADMQEFGFGQFYLKGDELPQILGEKWTSWTPRTGQNWHSFNDYINFSDKKAWSTWWGKDWVRSDIGDYDSPKFDDLKMSLASLPDLKTEAESAVQLPVFFQHKDTNAKTLNNARVRDYLITWLTDWVRKYGVDGFRVDTAKHVEQTTWLQLKQSVQKALQEWQQEHPNHFADDFWMTGEAWGHGVHKTAYFENGFDSMINFDFQEHAKNALNCFADIEPIYQEMRTKMQDFDVLSYLSSHDTKLFFHSDSQSDFDKQRTAASLLMLSPSAVQIFYGDESGRPFGATGSDPMQGTRSDMNWTDLTPNSQQSQLLQHWQKLGQFRKQHLAVGLGKHNTLKSDKYVAFTREYKNDKIMVIWAGNPQFKVK